MPEEAQYSLLDWIESGYIIDEWSKQVEPSVVVFLTVLPFLGWDVNPRLE